MATLFTKIINREIPAEIVFENDHVVAFKDISPQAPVHIVITTRTPIPSLNDLEPTGDHMHILNAAQKIAAELGLHEGYRVVLNCGEAGGQTVPHLHAHLLGGRTMTWPPG